MIIAWQGIRILFFTTYLVVFLKYWGQTPGKMLMGIKVVRLDGLPLRWSDVGLRYLGEITIVCLWRVVAWFGKPTILLMADFNL